MAILTALNSKYINRNIFDKTTPRLDENSKIIVVEGAHAVGKTAFAQELAENLEMKYFPHVCMDNIYLNHYGDDLRKYSHLLTSYNQPWDEKVLYCHFPNMASPLSSDFMVITPNSCSVNLISN